jgi:outer membrane lipoprotein-sorting protein
MRRAITAIAIAVLIPGCLAHRPAPVMPPAQLPTARQLLDTVKRRRLRLTTLRTLAKLRYRSPSANESARNVLAVERPDRLRVEVLSVLGSVLVMTSDGGLLTAYLPREATVYRGTASAGNLARYLPGTVSVPAIIDHVLATPPLLERAQEAVDWDGNLIRLTQSDGARRWVAGFRDIDTPASYRELDRYGRTTIDAQYDDIDSNGPIPIARRITVRFPETDESLEITMRDPEVNPRLSDRLFSLDVPPETTEIDLDGAPL